MKRWSLRAWIGGSLAAFALTASVTDALGAAGPGALAGSWSGAVTVQNRPVSVNLSISKDGATQFHYGVPRSCGLNAEYSGDANGRQYFSFTVSSGGVCDALIGGYLAVLLGADGTLAFDAASSDGQTSTSGSLRRASENKLSNQLVGKWKGQVMAGGRPVAFEATVLAGSIGDEAAQLHYGAPRSCQLHAEYEGIWQGQAAFGMKSATGGYCDRVTNGLLLMTVGGGGTLGFSIRFPDGTPGDSGTLRTAP